MSIATEITRLQNAKANIKTAIEGKGGTVASNLKIDGYAACINNIPTSGVTPTGTINITANGTHDVSQYASANVNVPTGGTEPSLGMKSITANGTYTASDDSFDGYSQVTVNVPTGSTPTGTKQISITENGTTTEDVSAYANVEVTVNVPSSGSVDVDDIVGGTYPSGNIVIDTATTIHDYGIYKNTAITSIFSTSLTSLGAHAVKNCNNLQTFVGTVLGSGIANYGISGNTALTAIDIVGKNSSSLTKFADNAFNGDTSLSVLILRGNYVPGTSTGSFKNTPFADGGTGGTLYVPSSMISAYEADSTWATIIGYTNNNIVAIEGSQYETAYADGTPISTT